MYTTSVLPLNVLFSEDTHPRDSKASWTKSTLKEIYVYVMWFILNILKFLKLQFLKLSLQQG